MAQLLTLARADRSGQTPFSTDTDRCPRKREIIISRCA